MILLPPASSVSGIDRYGLDLLVDLSRLLPAEPGASTDVVRLEITDRGPAEPGLRECFSDNWYLERSDGHVAVPRSVLRLVGAVAGATAEQKSTRRDRHDRVPPSENPLAESGLEKQAVISRAAASLRDSVLAVAGRRVFRLIAPWPEGRRWAAALTHDLDLVEWWPLAVLARIAELGRKGKLGLALRAFAHMLVSTGRKPVWKGVQAILDSEAAYSARSTWFVLCETPTLESILASDVTYRPESTVARRIIRDLCTRRCEVGLHGSFATATEQGAFERQRDRLARICGMTPLGVRQHFLRMRPGPTQASMRAAGFQYDSTYGFSDRNGFRLGVADVLPLWDAAREQLVGLEEAPFCWMDRALSKYRAVEDPAVWVDEGLALVEECRALNGLWVGVWHPNVYPALGFPGASDAFVRLMAEVAARHPWFGTLSTIVQWRVARRSVRAKGIRADGQVEATASPSGVFAQYLETVDGHRLEAVQTTAS